MGKSREGEVLVAKMSCVMKVKKSGGGCANLEDEFAEASDVNLCDVEEFLVCLFK